MTDSGQFRLQCIVSALVSAAFTNIYITQPILPVLQKEFAVDTVAVSFTVSAVILGIAIANLPFGFFADRLPIRPILLTGGAIITAGALVCAITSHFWLFIGARLVQGVFTPALTTCVAAYLARTMPNDRLNVVMGSYVAATVLGGMAGRLLGGWTPLHWRYAFLSAAALVLAATLAALYVFPHQQPHRAGSGDTVRVIALLSRWDLMRIYMCAAGSFALFSSIFNYLPFRLAGPPFGFSTQRTTLLYLSYIVGIAMGPAAGRISNRYGSGNALLGGSILLGGALALIVLPSAPAVVVGLLCLCAGFFTIHASAVGLLNRRLQSGQGRANALYVLCYYTGGWLGITASGFGYTHGGWRTVIILCTALVLVPLTVGLCERRAVAL